MAKKWPAEQEGNERDSSSLAKGIGVKGWRFRIGDPNIDSPCYTPSPKTSRKVLGNTFSGAGVLGFRRRLCMDLGTEV